MYSKRDRMNILLYGKDEEWYQLLSEYLIVSEFVGSLIWMYGGNRYYERRRHITKAEWLWRSG